MSLEENKTLVVNFMEEVWNQLNVAAIPSYFMEGSMLAGSLENWVRGVNMSFSDWSLTVEEVLAEGDKVVVRTMTQGVNTGSFMGHPPTGKSIQSSRISIYKIKNNKIVSMVSETDWLMMYKQLGIVPSIEG